MSRSAVGMVIGSVALALAFNAYASNAQKFDPRDPAIWEEKPPAASAAQEKPPCEAFSSSVCPAWEDEKSDIQRERERREKRRWDYERNRSLRRD